MDVGSVEIPSMCGMELVPGAGMQKTVASIVVRKRVSKSPLWEGIKRLAVKIFKCPKVRILVQIKFPKNFPCKKQLCLKNLSFFYS